MRLIDADKLILHLEDEIDECKIPFGSRANGKGIAYGTKLGLKSAISFAQTAPTIDIKTEVAREIFAEIEKTIANLEYRANTPRKIIKVEELKAQVNWVLHEAVPQTLTELKNKYTEGNK